MVRFMAFSETQAQALAYAQDQLRDTVPSDVQPFRDRASHVERVCRWLERLIVPLGVEDTRAMRLAAALHDIGYIVSRENHGANGAPLVLAYARENGIDDAVAERAAWLVAEHSNKEEWMQNPDIPQDLLLLMEADLLDEEGAMGLVLDCLTTGATGGGYPQAYEQMCLFEPKRLDRNPMITPLARQYWDWKQRIIRDFMAAYAFDIGVADEE